MKKSAEGVVRSGQKLLVLLEKYKFVLLVILTGVVLLTLPDLGGSATAREQATRTLPVNAGLESDCSPMVRVWVWSAAVFPLRMTRPPCGSSL